MSETKKVTKIKQLVFDADEVEKLRKSMLKRPMGEISVNEYINIIQFLQSGVPLEEDKE